MSLHHSPWCTLIMMIGDRVLELGRSYWSVRPISWEEQPTIMYNNRKLIIAFFCDHQAEAIRSLIERGWSFAELLFPEFNLKIGKCSFGFTNEPAKMKSHNLYDFTRSKKKALQENEKSNLLYANFCSLPDTYKTDPYLSASFSWLMDIACGHASNPGVDYIQVGIDTSVLGVSEVLKDERSLERFCSRILGVLSDAQYGIASIIPSKYAPGGYSIGLPGGAPDEYIWDVNAWGGRYGVRFDKLRSVHGFNFLGQSLLDQSIGSTPLKQWIFSGDKNRGVLSKGFSDLFLWKTTQGENLLDALDWGYPPTALIRKELQEQNAFAWQDWLKRKR
jgi:hypothetical protein